MGFLRRIAPVRAVLATAQARRAVIICIAVVMPAAAYAFGAVIEGHAANGSASPGLFNSYDDPSPESATAGAMTLCHKRAATCRQLDGDTTPVLTESQAAANNRAPPPVPSQAPLRSGKRPPFGIDFSSVPFTEFGKRHDLPPNMHGIYIYQTYPDTPAYKAGLGRGYVIVSVNGQLTPNNNAGDAAFDAAWRDGAPGVVLECWNTATGKVETFSLPFPASETVTTPSGPATLAVVSTTADPTTHPTPLPADNIMLVAYNYLCTKTATSAIMQPTSQLTYHQAIGYEPHKSYLMCSTHGEWGAINPYCAQAWLAPYSLVCKGGIANPAELTLAMASQTDKSLPPISIAAGSSPPIVQVPYKDEGQLKTQQLPAGWGMIVRPHDTLTTPRNLFARALAADFAVIGTPPAGPNTIHNYLFDFWPFAQIVLAILTGFYALLAFVGRYAHPTSLFNPPKPLFLLVLTTAFIGIYGSAYDPKPYTSRIFAEATAVSNQVNADRAALPSLFTSRDDNIEPFTKDVLEQAKTMLAPHVIPDTTNLQTTALIPVFASLAPLVLFLLLFMPWVMAGWYHLFVRPPIEKTLKQALRSGGPIDTKAANKDLAIDPAQLRNPPPAFQSMNDSQILNVYITETERQAAELAARAKATEAALNRKQSLLDKFNVASRLMRAIQWREVNRRDVEELQQKLRETEARLAAQEKSK